MVDYDVIVCGGGLGAVSATLAAAKSGATVLLLAEGDWLGGQATTQLVPPDEHPWIEQFGCSESYRDYREGIRAFYRQNFALTTAARVDRHLNPGLGNVGPLTHEPYVSVLVLESMLYPWVSRGLVRVLKRSHVTAVEVIGDRVGAIEVVTDRAAPREYRGHFLLDATELGDLLELARIEHVIGAESRSDTGELHALPGAADPLDQQAITWGMLLGYVEGEDHTISRPSSYEHWRTYQPEFWPGPFLGWEIADYVTHLPRTRPLFTVPDPTGFRYDLWSSRRIQAGENLEGSWRSDVTAALWPMMDYFARPLLGVTPEQRELALAEARDLSLSLLYWIQTEAPRHDGGTGYPGLHTRPDLTGTVDGLAREPYIREARRILPVFRVTEQHIGVEARPGADGPAAFGDSVGIGAYRIDLHPSTSGRNTVDIDAWPFQIPLGALIPARVENVLAAAKNVGTTHVTNGAYRVHPVEWSIGEAAGALAAFCIQQRTRPHGVRSDASLLRSFQETLATRFGVPLEWPSVHPLTPVHRHGYRFGTDDSKAAS